MPRLAQPKSKRGCRRCKQRKVKCDEVHPTCGACARHNTTCEYDMTFVVTNPGESSRSRSRTGEPYRSSSRSPAQNSQEGSLSPSMILNSGTSTPASRIGTDIEGRDRQQELRLLHHYTAFTCGTFLSPVTVNLWRDVVPQLGFEHPFVLDMILSVSALHLSRLHPDNPEYIYANTDYHNRALAGHRSSVQKIDASNAEAVFATTILIAFHSFVTLGNPGLGHSPTSYELPIHWLKLAYGTRALVDACMPHIIARGRLTGLFIDIDSTLEGTVFLDTIDYGPLSTHARWDLDPLGTSSQDSAAYTDTFRLIASIHKAIREQENSRELCRLIVTLPRKMPKRFGELVEENHPRALAILGHIFTLLALVEGDEWWFEGITGRHIAGIRNLLPPEWHPLMFAPIQELQQYTSSFTW